MALMLRCPTCNNCPCSCDGTACCPNCNQDPCACDTSGCCPDCGTNPCCCEETEPQAPVNSLISQRVRYNNRKRRKTTTIPGGVSVALTTDRNAALTDVGKLVVLNGAVDYTYTIPADATTHFKVGDHIGLAVISTAIIHVAVAAGVRLASPEGRKKMVGRGVLYKRGPNYWTLSGRLG